MRFRPLGAAGGDDRRRLLIALSLFHYYTAGFGLLRETTHRGVHLAFVLGLIFLVFPRSEGAARRRRAAQQRCAWRRAAGDWLLGVCVPPSVLYIPWVFDDLAFRVGNPSTARRRRWARSCWSRCSKPRAAAWAGRCRSSRSSSCSTRSPGRSFPGLLKHAGASWSQLVNHQYLTSQGVYGVAVGVVATYVFHFVLFGVLATRIGLGQLFLDIASAVAGRYAGGPAKVSVFGSAMFGMLSGSSVANAVTVGSLTIPGDDPRRLQARICRRGGSGVFHRRADHAAGAGRGGVPDDRVPERCRTRPSSPRP